MKLLKFFFLALCAVVTFSCTSDEPDNPDNGEIISPDTPVPDPTGTVLLSMRDLDNGKTHLDSWLHIEKENFQGAHFVDLGSVSGLGNVSYIPKDGWASRVMVVPGHGYVAYLDREIWDQYYRIYVIDYIYSTSGGIIGADIKYQKPFYGVDEEIKINVSNLTFSNEGGEQGVVFENENIVVFTATSSAEWCKVERCTTHDTYFLYNGVVITVDPNEENLEDEEATVTLTTAYGKKKEIKVTRAAADANITIDDESLYDLQCVAHSPKKDTITVELKGNVPLDRLSTESDQEWCEVKLIDNSSRMASRVAEIKSIEGRSVSRSSVGSDAYSYFMQISLTDNNSEDYRSTLIWIIDKNSNAKVCSFVVAQEAGYFVTDNTWPVGLVANGAPKSNVNISFFVSHTEDYKISSSESWCKGSLYCYGEGNFRLEDGTICSGFGMLVYVSLEENTEETPRRATLTIATPDNGISREITIEQTGPFISFLNDVSELKYSKDEGTYSTWVYSSSEDIVVTSSEDWCEITATTYGLNSELGIATGVQIKLAANETSDDRTAIITAATSDGKIKKELKVTQSDKINVSVEKTKLWFDRKANSQTIAVTTDAATYTPISSDESWLTVSSNGENLIIRATATTKNRWGRITFEGSDTEIEVIQSKYAVGDNCSDYGTTGKVICMEDSIRLIAYRPNGTYAWSSENVVTGATSRTDGEYNMEVIKQIANWQSFYPVFAAVDALNVNGVTGWYLPASSEVLRIYQYDGYNYEYWSSTEINKSIAHMGYKNTVVNTDKSAKYIVYAFHRF